MCFNSARQGSTARGGEPGEPAASRGVRPRPPAPRRGPPSLQSFTLRSSPPRPKGTWTTRAETRRRRGRGHPLGEGARRPVVCTRSSPRGPGWPGGRPLTFAGPGVPRNLPHGGATCEPGELTGLGACCRPRRRWASGPRHRRRGPRVPRGGSRRTGEPAARPGTWPLGGEPQLLGVPRVWRGDHRAEAAAPSSCAPLRSRNSAGRGRRRLRSARGGA